VISLQVYVIGTILSMQIPFVGFQPVQSSEHMAVRFLLKSDCLLGSVKSAGMGEKLELCRNADIILRK
jgi:hypothetical protein